MALGSIAPSRLRFLGQEATMPQCSQLCGLIFLFCGLWRLYLRCTARHELICLHYFAAF